MIQRLLTRLFPEYREIPYAAYAQTVHEQIRSISPYAGGLAVVAWLGFLWIDPARHPENAKTLVALRLGLPLCGILILLTRLLRPLEGLSTAAYYGLAIYIMHATPFIALLSGNDPEYLTGYHLAVLVVSLFPARFEIGFSLTVSSFLLFHALTAAHDPEFFSRQYYSYTNLWIAFIVAGVIQYANERVRLRTQLRRRKLDETRLALKRRNEQMENDLSIARMVQNNLLPSSFPVNQHVEMHGVYQSMELVGGDFYDVHPFSESRYLLFIADASGHGVSAALVASIARMSFYHALEAGEVLPHRLLAFMSREIQQFLRTEHFLTAFALVIDCKDQEILFANAGHRPVLHFTETGVEQLDAPGTILGVVDNPVYELRAAKLAPGDLVCMYTDGIVEARNRAGDEFGVERLAETISKMRGESAQRLARLIFSDLRAFASGTLPGDDITLLLTRIRA